MSLCVCLMLTLARALSVALTASGPGESHAGCCPRAVPAPLPLLYPRRWDVRPAPLGFLFPQTAPVWPGLPLWARPESTPGGASLSRFLSTYFALGPVYSCTFCTERAPPNAWAWVSFPISLWHDKEGAPRADSSEEAQQSAPQVTSPQTLHTHVGGERPE